MARYKTSQMIAPFTRSLAPGLWALPQFAFCILLVLAAGVSAVLADEMGPERHALVVGIAQYERARDLRNPGSDARAMASRLQALGYQLHGGAALIDPDREILMEAFSAFAAGLPPDALAVVFLAGHGLTHGGDSYLIPADDGALAERADLARHGVPLRALTGRLAGRAGVRGVIFVDACSANALRGPGGSGAGGAGDLVVGPSGSMSLVYAAAPGQIAADGEGDHSPFTVALLQALQTAGAPLDSVVRDVTRHMRAQGEREQTPVLVQGWGDPDVVILVDR